MFKLQLRFFHSRPVRKTRGSPSSFLELKKFAPPSRLRVLTYLYALPFSVFFFVIAYQFLQIGTNPQQLNPSLGPEKIVKAVEDFVHHEWKHMKDIYFPFIWTDYPFMRPVLLFLFMLLLFKFAHTPVRMFREVVVSTIALADRADEAADAAATEVIRQIGYPTALKRLQAKYKRYVLKAPLPEEMASAPQHERLSYQLLYFSQFERSSQGFEVALARTLVTIGVEPPPELRKGSVREPAKTIAAPWSLATGDPMYLTLLSLASALSFYVVLCAFYVAVVPYAEPWLKDSVLIRGLLPTVEWATDRRWLALELTQQTIAFVIPLAAGMYLYWTRRAQKAEQETPAKTMWIVFKIQFVSSFIVWFTFNTLYVLLYNLGETKLPVTPFTFASIHFWVELLIAAAAPGIALFAWRAGLKLNIKGLDFLAAFLAAAAVFLLSRSAYEFLSGAHRGFYRHQMVMGGFLIVAYFCRPVCKRRAAAAQRSH